MHQVPQFSLAALVLAAGKGTRMKSDLPKVLHVIAGKPMLSHVISTLKSVGINDVCLILNPETNLFADFLEQNQSLSVCIQKSQKGTADAVASAADTLKGVKKPRYSQGEHFYGKHIDQPYIIICCGDTPALDPKIIADFITSCFNAGAEIGVVGAIHPEPHGYGRLVLDEQGRVERVVEEKDATDAIRKINLVNTGLIFAKSDFLFELLDQVTPNNVQKEYYLTDCFALAVKAGKPAFVYKTEHYATFSGINTKEQLCQLESWLQSKLDQQRE